MIGLIKELEMQCKERTVRCIGQFADSLFYTSHFLYFLGKISHNTRTKMIVIQNKYKIL